MDFMFNDCSSLKSIDISRWNMKVISRYAFEGCSSLTKIMIPTKMVSIEEKAFYNCKKLKSITIKTTKLTSKRVGIDAFKGVYAKATVKVPAKVLRKYKKLLPLRRMSKKAKIQSIVLNRKKAYKILKKYWTSLGNNMPDKVEYEGLKKEIQILFLGV